MKISYAISILLLCVLFLYGGCTGGGGNAGSVEREELSRPAATPVHEPVDGYSLYENDEYYVRVQYPDNWEVLEDKIGVNFRIPGENEKLYEGFTLLFQKATGVQLSLDRYVRNTIDGLRKYMKGFSLISSQETTLAGHPAWELVYTSPHEGTQMKYMSIYSIKGDIFYVVTFNALIDSYDNHSNTLRTMIDSVQFLR